MIALSADGCKRLIAIGRLLAAGLPALRILPAMNGQNDDVFGRLAEIDRVGETGEHRSASVAVNLRKRRRSRSKPRDGVLESLRERAAKPRPAFVVPLTRDHRFDAGLGPEDNPS
jgi:hypothetical protein